VHFVLLVPKLCSFLLVFSLTLAFYIFLLNEWQKYAYSLKVMAWISIFVKKKKKAKKNLETVILQSEMRYQLLQDKLTNIFTLIFS